MKLTRHNISTPSSQLNWRRRLLMWGSPLVIIGTAVAWKNWHPAEPVVAAPPAVPASQNPQRNEPAAKQIIPASAANPTSAVSATINGEQIARTDLSRECLARFGKPVIETMIHKSLISQHCAKANILVTDDDVRKEIDNIARKFGMAYDDYLKMLQTQRNVSPTQYANEVIWPMLALKRLANAKVQPTAAELEQAFEAKYGPAVQVRIIMLNDPALAKQVQAQAVQAPEEFGNLARKFSQDPSAGLSGMIQPIRRYQGSDKQFEAAAFALKNGEISPVVPLQLPGTTPNTPGSQQFVIMKCEAHYAAQTIPPEARANIELTLKNTIIEKKLQREATVIFDKMEKQAIADKAIVNVFNDPELRSKNPTVAAQVYQQQITLAELSEECLLRHGSDVLDTLINRRLLAQALRDQNLSVTQDDLDAEIAHAAILMGKLDANGRPDMQGWLKMVTTESGVSDKVYLEDSVWPSAALKKLAGRIEVTQDDLNKGFEANYGQRVRARAIVMNNLRKAQEVWELARQNPTLENFGKLAEQHSTDPSSRTLQGRIPPIEKFGGQPLIEKEAFALQPGQLSGIITIGESFVFLLCEGFTEPTKITFDEVKQSIYDDVHEKKQRLAMHQKLEEVKQRARIDNQLTGESKMPTQRASYQEQLQQHLPAGSKAPGQAPQMANPGQGRMPK